MPTSKSIYFSPHAITVVRSPQSGEYVSTVHAVVEVGGKAYGVTESPEEVVELIAPAVG